MSRKGLVLVGILFLIVLSITAYFVIRSKVPLDEEGNVLVSIPDEMKLRDDLFSSVLSNMEKSSIEGRAVILQGENLIAAGKEQFTLKVNEAQSVIDFKVAFSATTETKGDGRAAIKPLVEELLFTFSPAIQVSSSQKLTANIDRIALSQSVQPGLAISTDLEVGKTLADVIVNLFLNTANQSSALEGDDILEVFDEITINQCRLDLREGGEITFNDNVFITGPSCTVQLKEFQLKDKNNVTGNLVAELNIMEGSSFSIDSKHLVPESGLISLFGAFQIRDNTFTLSLDKDPERNFISVSNARLSEEVTKTIPRISDKKDEVISPEPKKKGKPKRNKPQQLTSKNDKALTSSDKKKAQGPTEAKTDELSLFIAKALFNFQEYRLTSDPISRQDKTYLKLTSKLKTEAGSIPISNGSLSFSSLSIPSLEIMVDETSDSKRSGSLITLPSIVFNRVTIKTEKGKNELLQFELPRFETKNLQLKGLQDGQLTLDSSNISIQKILYRKNKKLIQLDLGKQSKISLGNENLKLTINPTQKKAQPFSGKMRITGKIPSISTIFEGSELRLTGVEVDLSVKMEKEMSLKGSLRTTVPSSTIAESLKNIPPPEVKNLTLNPPSFSKVGTLQINGQIDLQGEKNTSTIELDMVQIADVLFTGKDLENDDVNIQAVVSAFQATVNFGKETGLFTMQMALRNNQSTCAHEETVKVLNQKLKEKFYLEPFNDVIVRINGDIVMGKDELLVRPKKWEQTNDQEITLKAKGALGSHRVSATLKDDKTSCEVFGIKLPESVCPGNMLRDKLDELCEKEFKVKM